LKTRLRPDSEGEETMTLTKNKDRNQFDLEPAIAHWKKSLRSLRAAQDGDLVELEGYLRDKIEELVVLGMSEEESFRKAASEFAGLKDLDGDYHSARSISRFGGRPSWQPPRLVPALLWNYLKIVARKLKRQKAYSFITLIGLTTGIAAFLLILLYCRFERGYDSFHLNGDRIYRIQNDRIYSLRHDRSAGCPPGLGPTLKEEFPEIAAYARLYNLSGDPSTVSRTIGSTKDSGSTSRTVAFFERRIFFADPAFLRIFSFPFVQGDRASALDEPEAAVLTEPTARKYFGGEDPLGQTITVTTMFGVHDYRVTGVCRDVPPNSHLKFDLLLSFRRFAAIWPSTKDQPWSSNAFLTYVLLPPSVNPSALEAKFPLLVEKYSLDSAELKREFHLQPLRSIHLTSRLRFEPDVNGDIKTVRFLEVIGLFILLIAWVNSINLSTARSLQRSKEVCVRKTLGAGRRQLAGQFLFESVLLNGLAFFLALGVVLTVLPLFSRLVGRPLSIGQLGAGWIWVSLSILAGAVLSGLYPAFILSSFKPMFALRGLAQSRSGGVVLRKALVVFQFALAILLMASTLIVGRQLAFMQNQDIGVDLERTLIMKIPEAPGTRQSLPVARDQMSKLFSVRDAAVSTSVPGLQYSNAVSGIRRQSAAAAEAQQAFIIDVDDNYFELFSIPLVCGRSFSRGYTSDDEVVVINEEMVNVLGFESAEKALLQNIVLGGFGGDVVQVVGVVKNYHHLSLREKIEPVLYFPLSQAYFRRGYFLSLRIDGRSTSPTISSIAAKWKEIFPGLPMEYSFLDDDFNSQYDADRRFGGIFGLASLLAIMISCLGLFGLASFSAERRTREIGIRKVFGASAPMIVRMLAGEFLRWVLLANLFAWPVTWILMSRWLQRFAYRTTVGLWPLGLAALLALAIALATVSYRAIQSATANPVDSIRYE
jgi:putative ABC transport system permease protein